MGINEKHRKINSWNKSEIKQNGTGCTIIVQVDTEWAVLMDLLAISSEVHSLFFYFMYLAAAGALMLANN